MDLLYKPKFCANCGEKIERAEWRIWTSRRFCQVCEIENKGTELLPRVFIGITSLICAASIFTLLSGATRPPVKIAGLRTNAVNSAQPSQAIVEKLNQGQAAVQNSQVQTPSNANAQAANVVPRPPEIVQKPEIVVDDVYICGAETKKGSPCSRKVHGNVRCWQHRGMPAMLTPEKLKVSAANDAKLLSFTRRNSG